MSDETQPINAAFEQRLSAAWTADDWRVHRVALAVSGGADSVALLCGMSALCERPSERLLVAHFNHGWRGCESDADEQFVIELCGRLGLECVVGCAEGRPAAADGSLEGAARAARYDFLQEVCQQRGIRYLATAHTSDDQVETILHHIIRGTGLAGLGGIPRVRSLSEAVTLVRPLLDISREQVLAYLAELGQPFREDASNDDLRHTRNRIRHDLLPLIERDYAPGVRGALLRLGSLAESAQSVIERAAEMLLDRCLTSQTPESLSLDCTNLKSADTHLVRDALVIAWRRQGWPLVAMGFEQWNLLSQLAQRSPSPRDATASKHVLPGGIIAERSDGQLRLAVAGGTSASNAAAERAHRNPRSCSLPLAGRAGEGEA
jgi:tRNA(Ile)-lysidine synthase